MDPEYDHNEGTPDLQEPEALPTAEALVALCDLFSEKQAGWEAGFSASDRPGGFCFNPWDNDISINFKGQEFILSLRPSNRIV